MLNQSNSKKQGDVGLGMAIGYYCMLGYTVSIPLTDSQDYDLVIDNGVELLKVQVKTTRYKVASGNYQANLRVFGGNRSGQTVKKFDPTKVDILFICVADGTKYHIPSTAVNTTGSITLSSTYDKYKV